MSARNLGDPGSIPRFGRSPEEGNGNPLRCSCLEIPWMEEPGGLYSPWGHKELDITEWLHFLTLCFYFWKLFLIYLEVHWSYYEFLSNPSSEKAMATHSSTLAWKIPWTEEPGGLQSMGLLRVGHYWGTSLSLFTYMHWRRKWQPIPVFLLENPRDGGAWWAAVYGVTQSQTRLKWLSSSIPS